MNRSVVRPAAALTAALALLSIVPLRAEEAPPYQTDFPADEFRARWERVFDRIGDKAVAVVAGAPLAGGFVFPRQTNEFYYLSGVETPGAYILLDGRTHRATLFL
ncbi:MAG TPA: aminopeptidase P N-terminal domain-containing protein, partial [Thermoanaerobaculia bacterium]|nr:aminopeptidase P N-terminal domain-containing protein [Thermoanaerobaculia bacterium]